MALSPLEFRILVLDTLIKLYQKTGEPVSSWRIAKELISLYTDEKDPKFREQLKKLRNRINHHLKQMSEKGLLTRFEKQHMSQTWFSYAPNPDRVTCESGIIFVLDNPLLIVACPYTDSCPYHDDPSIEKCPIIRESPSHLKEWLSKHIKAESSPKS